MIRINLLGQARPKAAKQAVPLEATLQVILFVAAVAVVPHPLAVGVVEGHGHYTSVFANRDSLYSAVGVGFWLIAACVWMLSATVYGPPHGVTAIVFTGSVESFG